MLVYHVDKSDRTVEILDYYGSRKRLPARTLWEEWEEYNAINENGKHPCFYIVPSADQDNLLFGHYSFGGYYYFDDRYASQIPFPGSTGVTEYAPMSWDDVEGPVTLSGIAYENGVVSFRAHIPTGEVDYLTIADAGSYHAGDRFTFALVRPEEVDAPASVVWYYDDEPAGADSVTLTAGSHTVDARLTYADGRQAVLTLEIEVD